MNIRTVFAGMLLAASALSFAWPPEGRYRQEIRNPMRGESYSLIRTLDLNTDGRAKLTTEYKGDRPSVDLLVRDDYGNIMERVSDHRIVYHSGTWRTNGDRIEVELTRLKVAGEERNVHSAFEFDLDRDELIAKRQDTGDYGDRMMRLRLSEKFRSDGEPDTKRLRGTYGWGEDIKADGGESIYMRHLKLNENGSAELVSEYSGERPRLDRQYLDSFGALFAEVVSNRKITHRGKWRESDGKIFVELDKVGGGAFAQNIRSAFRLDPRGDELLVLDTDRTDYGSREFRLKRDWTPRRIGVRGDAYQGLVSRNTTEFDQVASGGGFLNREGSKARELRQARLILRKNGDFELRVRGDGEYVFRGVYNIKSDTVVELEVREADGHRGLITGTVTTSKDSRLRKISIRGDLQGQRMTLTFDAGG